MTNETNTATIKTFNEAVERLNDTYRAYLAVAKYIGEESEDARYMFTCYNERALMISFIYGKPMREIYSMQP